MTVQCVCDHTKQQFSNFRFPRISRSDPAFHPPKLHYYTLHTTTKTTFLWRIGCICGGMEVQMVTKTGNTSLSRIYRNRMRDIHISIPETLDANIREFILTTYHGYEKGAISSVIIESLRLYLDPGTHTKAKINKILKSQT